jgi:hypothetical protein
MAALPVFVGRQTVCTFLLEGRTIFYRYGLYPIAKSSPGARDTTLGSQQWHSIPGDVMTETTVSEASGMTVSFYYGTSV